MKKTGIMCLTVASLLLGNVSFANSYEAFEATFDLWVNGSKYQSESPITVINGKTYLPLRELGEFLEATVMWDGNLKRVSIDTNSSASNSSLTKERTSIYDEVHSIFEQVKADGLEQSAINILPDRDNNFYLGARNINFTYGQRTFTYNESTARIDKLSVKPVDGMLYCEFDATSIETASNSSSVGIKVSICNKDDEEIDTLPHYIMNNNASEGDTQKTELVIDMRHMAANTYNISLEPLSIVNVEYSGFKAPYDMEIAVEYAKALTQATTAGFPRSKVIEAMLEEGFSYDQAVYGADNCGASWRQQAVISARFFLKNDSDITKEVMFLSLVGIGYTAEEAEYATNKVF